MKEILLKPEIPFATHVDVAVYDFPRGREEEPRWRCAISVDYARSDIRTLTEKGLDRAGMLDWYRDEIFREVKILLGMEWTCVGGMEEVLTIVSEHLPD